MSSQAIDMGAQMMQALKPVKRMKQHTCNFVLYSHDLSCQLEVHHFVSRLNRTSSRTPFGIGFSIVNACAILNSIVEDPNPRRIGSNYSASFHVA
jgi:hypothetical protein